MARRQTTFSPLLFRRTRQQLRLTPSTGDVSELLTECVSASPQQHVALRERSCSVYLDSTVFLRYFSEGARAAVPLATLNCGL